MRLHFKHTGAGNVEEKLYRLPEKYRWPNKIEPELEDRLILFVFAESWRKWVISIQTKQLFFLRNRNLKILKKLLIKYIELNKLFIR